MDELIWAKQGSWHRLWHRVGIQYTGGGTAAFCRESLLECAVGDGTKERGLGRGLWESWESFQPSLGASEAFCRR